jgi:RNA polymerase sigma factor (sigma-70 family)
MNATLARLTRLAVDLRHEPDARLLDRFVAGSEPAFRELVSRHGPLVFGVCNRVLRHRQDAEDAFQAVFVVLARRAADVWPRDAIGAWLYGVAYRVALKALATRCRRKSREQPLVDVACPPATGLEPDIPEIIDRVVRKLPEVYRAAVVACDLEGLSRKDAAEQLGWTEGTLSGRLARARRILADRLRKAGVSLPASGLAVVLGTDTPVRAGLSESIVEVVSGNAAAGVPAPVAALAERVVQSMCAFKLKVIAASVLVACAIGYGAWTAGAGDGPGAGTSSTTGSLVAAAQPPVKPKAEPLPTAKLATALELLQGKWRVESIAEGKNVKLAEGWPEFEITGASLLIPYKDATAGWKHEKYSLAVDDTKMPKTIDLIAPGKPVGRGIYELTAPATTCASCHTTEGLGVGPLGLKPPPNLIGLCGPGLKQRTGLRLALAIEGPRPAKFGGGEGVIEFTLERAGERDFDHGQLDQEIRRLTASIEAMRGAQSDKEEVQRAVAKLRVLQAKREEDTARIALQVARADLQKAQAQFALRQTEFARATWTSRDAELRLADAEKEAKKSPPTRPAKDTDVFTIHIRPLAAREIVVSVNATGKETVLEGLAYAAEDMAIKPDAVSVWVVRGKEILPVDLVAITKKGETKTNYTLKAGDQLFVQVKVAK